ncbi:MAG: SMC family ATPase, partial [Nanoarchaeota archaeon]|nr:SMC family ATPase [Nanoarchaeota archaeon]
MLLKKIKLENIRSYLDSEIVFPEGSTLLAGNIGCGKSTILLGIDFALFGLTRGILNGNALLRNGKDFGGVELTFDLDGREVIIKRGLKKNSTGIVQDTGHIILDGVREEKSAVELKQAIIDLLNYPKDLLTKSKGLIYRYTVYTPQEEMKQILLGDNEVRLNTLRKVFGIDKYKRIQENSKLFLAKLREKRKELIGRISDLEDKKKEKLFREEEKDNVLKLINEIIPFYEEALNKTNSKKEEIKILEDKKELRNNYV